MKKTNFLKKTAFAISVLAMVLLTNACDNEDDTEYKPVTGAIPEWLHGSYSSMNDAIGLNIYSDSIVTKQGLRYFHADCLVKEETENTFSFISGNGCINTFTREGDLIRYNLRLPGEPGEKIVGGVASKIVKAVAKKLIKIIIDALYAKKTPAIVASDDRLYVLTKYSGTKFSVSSAAFLPDGGIPEDSTLWTTAQDVVGPECNGMSYSSNGLIHLSKEGLAEVRTYWSEDIDQGKVGENHLSTGVGTYPFDPSSWGDYTYTFSGSGGKKIYIGKFYADHNKDKVDKVRILDNGGASTGCGLTLSPDGTSLFVSSTPQEATGLKTYELTAYNIDPTNDKGAKSLSQTHHRSITNNIESWPMTMACDGKLLYMLMKTYDGSYKYHIVLFQMNLTDTDYGWINLADYLDADSDFTPSDIAVKGNYLYVANGTPDGDDGQKFLEIQLADEQERTKAGANGLNVLRDAKISGIEWILEKD